MSELIIVKTFYQQIILIFYKSYFTEKIHLSVIEVLDITTSSPFVFGGKSRTHDKIHY